MHALIVGTRGVGKSTLINKVVKTIGRPVWGFETKKEDSLANDEKGSPIYIYEAGKEHRQELCNLVGYCKNKKFDATKQAFDLFAVKLKKPIPAESIVVFDEIGFMESSSEDFCNTVLSVLDGNVPVIAAVKHNDFPFLNKVKAHPNCRCFYITEENRNTLFTEVMDFFNSQKISAR